MSEKEIKKKEEEIEEETEEEKEEETEKEEEGTEAEEEEVAEKAAKKISKYLDLEALKTKIDKVIGRDESLAKKIYSESDLLKDKDNLTAEEKIVGFFQAMVNQDRVALKALSEGVAADGGYLFPDEFRAELIRDLEEPTRMRSLVRVIPMKRDIMKIPKLVSKPTVRWTSENAAKSTTTADFTEKTLTAYKVAAISLQSGIKWRHLIKKAINSVELLINRTIPSQALVLSPTKV